MVRQVNSNDEFRALVKLGEGFLYNDFGGRRNARGNLLHRASCPHLRMANVSVPKWAFGTDADAEQWLLANRGSEGVGWSRCAFCMGGSSRKRAPVSTSAAPPLRATSEPVASPTREDLAAAMAIYREARATFLEALGIRRSNRDPLAEFSERLVAAIVGGRLTDSRVERGHDVVGPTGRRVQVKYLANPKGEWINGHTVKVDDHLDDYALVLVEDLEPRTILMFEREQLASVGAMLGKRHPDQDRTLQLTRSNVESLTRDRLAYRPLGVRAAQAPDWQLD